ncbi:MAG: AbrB/MazE/SpoVT family DNA-binding domain-containing protein [Sphingorhabdus sp.]|uniref:AbrB/MazE/SpoVT family DNA-binding domain-containing protein n=1 Tax=Sphingorhabdus sp. TaxID=1902408 RepID=UPI0025EE27AF|nr:AbrB/MazE/SpoVT family DNA-binding domain-containing protein [Sphingorhabdus sp.]MCO4092903.1 AbrB/MazE/SpoVT family DNA-binding domain-containing protein [Sphingorhabdus sp.]
MSIDVRVAQNGRMVLPRAVRKALGMTDGGTVVVSIEGDEVTLSSIRHSVRHAQELYRQHVQNDMTSDDFIAERRAEADRDKGA